MAKHVAYPCFFALFFMGFGQIEGKSSENFSPNHEKDNAIFSQYTSVSGKSQDNFAKNLPKPDILSDSEYSDDWDSSSKTSPFRSKGDETPLGSQSDDDWDSSSCASPFRYPGDETSSGPQSEDDDLNLSTEETDDWDSSSCASPFRYQGDEASSDSQSEDEARTEQEIKAPSSAEEPSLSTVEASDERSQNYILHLQIWVDLVKRNKPQTPDEHRLTFLNSFPTGVTYKDVYRVIKYEPCNNTHCYAPGVSPAKKGSPRRANNIKRLLNGEAAVWVDPRSGERGEFHMHHLGQIHEKTFIVMLPVDIHREKGFHTELGASKINRALFATERRDGRVLAANNILKDKRHKFCDEEDYENKNPKRFKLNETYYNGGPGRTRTCDNSVMSGGF